VVFTPRQLREARSSTAHSRVRQLVSPGRQPMTLVKVTEFWGATTGLRASIDFWVLSGARRHCRARYRCA